MTSSDNSSACSRTAEDVAAPAFADYVADLGAFIGAAGDGSSASAPNSGGAGDRRFGELARRLFVLHYRTVAPYRRLCEARGVSPATICDWHEIPALPTTAFKEHAVTSLLPEERCRVFHSSGTSARESSRHYHNAESLALYERSLLAWFRVHLLPEARRTGTARHLTFVVLTPAPEAAPHSSLVHMFGAVVGRWGSPESAFMGRPGDGSGWQLDLPRTRAALADAVRAGVPVCVLGTAFSFVHWLDHGQAERVRFELPPGSRLLETGGYKGRSRRVAKAELHESLSAALGILPSHIVCEYGMSELSSQAYDAALPAPSAESHGTGRAFRFPPWARAWVVSPETGCEVGEGETGLLRVLDLANARSVLVVQTEDLAIRRGAGFELVGRARGSEPRGCSLTAAPAAA